MNQFWIFALGLLLGTALGVLICTWRDRRDRRAARRRSVKLGAGGAGGNGGAASRAYFVAGGGGGGGNSGTSEPSAGGYPVKDIRFIDPVVAQQKDSANCKHNTIRGTAGKEVCAECGIELSGAGGAAVRLTTD